MTKRQISIFLFVGCLTVGLDFAIYRGLSFSFLISASLAKTIGFIGGCVFAYFANRYWTFNQKITRSGSFWRFSLVYAVSLIVNVSINQSILSASENPEVIYIAFLIASGVSAILNFVGMKSFVFTRYAFGSRI